MEKIKHTGGEWKAERGVPVGDGRGIIVGASKGDTRFNWICRLFHPDSDGSIGLTSRAPAAYECEGNASLIELACEVPHDCDDDACPGNVNRRKLELLDELAKATTELLRGIDEWDAAVSKIIDTSEMPKWAGKEKARAALARHEAER